MNKRSQGRLSDRYFQLGVTLLELIVVVVIIAVLAAIAVPTYSAYVVRTRRVAAEACLMQLSNLMERTYTTNSLSYLDSAGEPPTLVLDCTQPAQTGHDYGYIFLADQPTANTYTIQAEPSGAQKVRDTKCGALTINQSGTRTSSGTETDCWR